MEKATAFLAAPASRLTNAEKSSSAWFTSEVVFHNNRIQSVAPGDVDASLRCSDRVQPHLRLAFGSPYPDVKGISLAGG